MINRRQAALACAGAVAGFAWKARARVNEIVRLLRIPQGGLQPQAAIDAHGMLHLVYQAGDPHKADVYYVTSTDGGSTFSSPLRVNSQPGSAIALGTIRGAQLALGRAGRAHVAWNGSSSAEPSGPRNPADGKSGSPMLYSRLDDAGARFEPQRNLMLHSFWLDGGGSVAADPAGNVYVAWHGVGEAEIKGDGAGEARRRVWLTKSADDGRTFAAEAKAWLQPTGACGCCGMKIFADREGDVSALYRSARQSVHRDIYLLRSKDHSASFEGRLLSKWEINACPMSSMDLAANDEETVAAWETEGQIYWTRGRNGSPLGEAVAAPGAGKGRKHPRVAINRMGEVLLAWTEGTGWQRGGSLAWQMYDRDGRSAGDAGHSPGIPAWSFAAAAVRPDGGFAILY